MKIRHILIIIVTILIIIAFGVTSSISYNIGVNYGEKNAETIRSEKIKDSTLHIEKEKIVQVIQGINELNKQIIESSGRVSSLKNITVSSEVQGRLKGRKSLKKGRKFRKGNVLFSIKDTDISLLLESRKSRLLNLISLNLADIQLDFPEEYSKWENFFNNISTDRDLPDFPKYGSSKEKNFIISKSILSEYLSIKSEEERLKKYTVYAPFNGSITRSYTDIGATVNPGTPIIDIIKQGSMEIELPINKSEINDIDIGNIVRLTDGESDLSGKIVRKGDFIDRQTQNISIFAEISWEQDIYSGMYLKAIIEKNGKVPTMNIPRRAIFGDNKVYIVQNNTLHIKEIKIHSSNANSINIIGIEDSTLVVSEPIINAKEGMKVTPELKQ